MVLGLVIGFLGLRGPDPAAAQDPGAGAARPSVNQSPGEAVEVVFSVLEHAWIEGNQQALSQLVHPEGLTVNIAGPADRPVHYSPSQSYYFFRNLFQSYRTLSFSFRRVQDVEQDRPVHGLALWERRRPSSQNVQAVKLVFVIAWDEGRPRLREITTLK